MPVLVRGRRRSAGFTLVELMVAMLLGLILLGVMQASYMASLGLRRSSLAQAQMAEDAGVAMGLLRAHLGLAGFSRPVQPGAGGQWVRAASGTDRWLFGCDGDFVSLAEPIDALACEAGGPGRVDALALAYEADAQNSLTRRERGQWVPTDCLGNSLDPVLEGGRRYYLSYSRFYVDHGALYCRGPGAPGGQVLAENVVDLQLRYGVALAGGDTVGAYLDASQVSAAGAWSRVLTVRVCLLMRSEAEVLPAVTDYQGCDAFAAPTRPSDRRLYRSYATTVLLHNRSGVAL